MSIDGSNFRLSFFLTVILAGWTAHVNAQADPRLDLFVQKYENLKNKRLSLAHPGNPFYPYIDKHFETGLDSKDKAELARVQENGDCIKVDLLVIKGFLQLYPFLEPAFLDETNGNKLKFMISSGYSAPGSRCFAYMQLNELRARRSLEEFAPIDVGTEMAIIQKQRRDHQPETDRNIIYEIQFRLGRTAFCSDYPPSIKDVLTAANKNGGMILTVKEELYLTERARLHGLFENSEYQQKVEKIMRRTSSQQRFRSVEMASRRSRLHEIEAIDGFWSIACKVFYKDKTYL
ncbi:hypothetical protein MNBD_ALPHA09-1692 [hydrothermal vent metagenome]|uniref:Uncharacterized protein n=1 Tax=hydrothermal vent metagenome TaxID=652676 RepID=A0A3B0UDV8_9ZZZZ